MGYNQDVVVACASCSAKVPISQTTYGDDKNLICFSCYNSIARGSRPDRVVQTSIAPDKIYYKCNVCGFSFSRSANFQFGGHCFNCGKKSVQVIATNDIVMKDRKSLLDY